MFCPGCGLHVSDDLKFCRQCGANLHGVRDAITSRADPEKFDWSKTWLADVVLAREELERRRGITPEMKRLDEIKNGVITSMVGIGVMIFLRFFLDVVANQNPPHDAEIIRSIWMVGIIPFMIGIGMIFNGLIVSRRLIKLKEQQAQKEMPAPPAPTALPAKTTDQLVAHAKPQAVLSVVEDTTAHLPEAVTRTAAPPSDLPSSPASPGEGRPTGR